MKEVSAGKGYIHDLVTMSIASHLGYNTRNLTPQDADKIKNSLEAMHSLGNIKNCAECGGDGMTIEPIKPTEAENPADRPECKIFEAMNDTFAEFKQGLIDSVNTDEFKVYDTQANEIDRVFGIIHPKFTSTLTEILTREGYDYDDQKRKFMNKVYDTNKKAIASLRPPKEYTPNAGTPNGTKAVLRALLKKPKVKDMGYSQAGDAVARATYPLVRETRQVEKYRADTETHDWAYNKLTEEVSVELNNETQMIKDYRKISNGFDCKNEEPRVPCDKSAERTKFIESYWVGTDKKSYLRNASVDTINCLMDSTFDKIDKKGPLVHDQPRLRDSWMPKNERPTTGQLSSYKKPKNLTLNRSRAESFNLTAVKSLNVSTRNTDSIQKPNLIRSISKEEVK